VPVVALRAGLIVGPDGSSFRMVANLSRRLPLMLTPTWTRSPTQPIALQDVVAVVRACLDTPGLEDQSFDIAGPDVVTYSELLLRAGRALGHERTLLAVPFFTPRLSVLWVSLVTGAPRELVAPLVESLRHRMVARNTALQDRLGLRRTSLDAALRTALDGERPGRTRRRKLLSLPARSTHGDSTVRSVQRLPLPPGWTAERVAGEYLAWLPRRFGPILQIQTDSEGASFRMWPLARPLLVLRRAPGSTEDRQLFFITGGVLARTGAPGAPGRLEFRTVLSGEALLAGVHDFRPRLPWWLYLLTQARVHLWVMRSFARHLARRPESRDPERSAVPAR
jgi:hypothetical protein